MMFFYFDRGKYGRHIMAAGLLLCGALSFPSARAASHKMHSFAGAHSVVLSQQTGTPEDEEAKKLAADDIATSRRHNAEPLVLIGTAQLSIHPSEKALFIQLQSSSLCGSAGCTTDVYRRRNGSWEKILDSISGDIAVLPASHNGMHDILIDGNDRWIWKGGAYQDTISAPSDDGLRDEIRDFQKKNAVKDPG
ncbi:MAG: hypothetical protein SOH81_03195 [Acetobacter sp.]|jgi:hypothetical protein